MKFRVAGIKAPQSLKESSRTDKAKYCRYHRSQGHDTEECFQLREAIQDLIKNEKLGRFVDKGR